MIMELEKLVERIEGIEGDRIFVAIAGAPANGKSTIAEAIVTLINGKEPGSAAVLGMDGFHFDDSILKARGHLARKGSPHTFDVVGFHQLLKRLAKNDEVEIAIPIFDRELELSRNAASLIPQSVKTIIIEGNYLLLDDPNWAPLREIYNLTIMLNIPIEEVWTRLQNRWRALNYSAKDITEKIEGNDLINAQLVINNSVDADIFIENV